MKDTDLDHLAALARLDLEDDERDALRADLEQVLTHFEAIADVDVTGLEPMLRPIHGGDALREDVVRPGLDPEAARALARARDGDFVKVPRTAADDG